MRASVTTVKPWGMAALAASVLASVAAYVYLWPDGDSETDKAADKVASCLTTYPMINEAPSFVRHLRDHRSDCAGAEVLEYTQLGSPWREAPESPTTRLVFRIYLPASNEFGGRVNAITACYRAEFDWYGPAKGGPDRVHCPKNALPVTPPDAQRLGLPDNIGTAAAQVLRDLPAASKDDVLKALSAKLPPALLTPPTLDLATRDGITVIAAGSMERGVIDCRLAVRKADGTVKTWAPDYSLDHASEVSCDTERAFRTYEAEAK